MIAIALCFLSIMVVFVAAFAYHEGHTKGYKLGKNSAHIPTFPQEQSPTAPKSVVEYVSFPACPCDRCTAQRMLLAARS